MAKQAKIDIDAVEDADRQEYDIVAAVVNVASIDALAPVASPAATPAATTAPRPNSRKRTLTRCICISKLVYPSCLVDALAYF